MTTTILFDLWGTLIEPITTRDFYHKIRVLELLKACGKEPSNEFLELALSIYEDVEDEIIKIRKSTLREISAEKTLSIFFKRLGMNVQVGMEHLSAYSKPFLELTRLRKGAKETIRVLSREYPLVLVSNLSLGWMGKEVLRRNGLLGYFSATLFSEEVGYRKPHPKIFQLALRVTKSDPCDCIMVGDELEDDMLGAKNLGIKTIWIAMKERNSIPKYVDEVAHSLEEIPDIIKRLIN